MKCGIVILNYNDFNTTSNLLDNIKEYELINKIVIVDNYSTDGSYKKLCEYRSKKIVILRAPGNNGYSVGNNIGIRYLINNTDVDIIGIANSDVEFKSEFIEKILNDFENNKDYSIITGLQVNLQGEIAGYPFWEEYTTEQWIRMKLSCFYFISKFRKKSFSSSYILDKLNKNKSLFQVGAVEGSLFLLIKKIL